MASVGRLLFDACDAAAVGSLVAWCANPKTSRVVSAILAIHFLTVREASPVRTGMGSLLESLGLSCTIDKLEKPGPMPRTAIVSKVPDPFTPAVFGWRVTEITACPCSLSTR